MCSDSFCDDPTDISMLLLKILAKCLSGDVGFVFYLSRCVTGQAINFAECVVLVTNVLDVFSEDDTTLEAVTLTTMTVMYIGAIMLLAWLGGGVLRMDVGVAEKRKAMNRFFLVFKAVNVVFTAALTAGAIYGWEELDIENLFKDPIDGAKVFLVVSLAIDIVMDPTELLLGCCVVCRN